MKYNPITRRQFLVGAGGFTLALPLLPSMLPKALAQAASAGIAKRFITIHNGHCQIASQWLPDPTKFTFTEQGPHAREVLLSSIRGSISPVLGTEFDSLRSKINLISRLDPTSSQPNHNAEVLLTGGVKTEIQNSLDQVLAKKLYNGSPLNLYVRSVFDQYYSGASHLSVAGGQYVSGQFNPSAVFANLFGTSGGGAAGPDPTLIQKDVAVVDLVFKQFQALRKSKRLSKEDGQRLDQHMEMVAQVDRKLKESITTPSGGSACMTPRGPASSPVFSQNAPDYQVVIDQMFDVLEVGIKCGKVKVATVMMHVYDYFNGSIGFIPGVSGDVKMHEDVGHAGSENLRAMKLALNKWFGLRVARFLKNLDVVEDPVTGLTYLDNSIILWGNDQGAVNDGNAHTSINLPILLAGSAGGFLKTGRFIDYGPSYGPNQTKVIAGDDYGTYKRGRPYNQLLITIAQAMGLQPADYETAGVQGFGVYGSRTATHDYLGGNHKREILPLLKA